MTLPLVLQTSLKDVKLHKLTVALTNTFPLQSENQTDISKYLTRSVPGITPSDPSAAHTCTLTGSRF